MEYSQLQIPKALLPVADALNSAAAAASRGPTVSDKEWKTLLGKLVSSLIKPKVFNTCLGLCCLDMLLWRLAIFPCAVV